MASMGKAGSNKDYNRILNERGPKLSTVDGKAPPQSFTQSIRSKLFAVLKKDSTPKRTKERIMKLRDSLEMFKEGSRQYDDAMEAASKILMPKTRNRKALINRDDKG